MIDAGSPSTTADDVYGWVERATGSSYAIGFYDLNNGGSQNGGKNTVVDKFGIEISSAGTGLPSNTSRPLRGAREGSASSPSPPL